MRNITLAVGFVGAFGLFSGTHARATTLQDLITQNTQVVSGGLIYSNFTAGGNLPASDVSVIFTANGVQFMANWNTLTPGHDSSVIQYKVSASQSTISRADLFFAGQVILTHATASVGETLSDLNSGKDYSMSVFYDGQGSPNDDLRDSIAIDPTATSLWVIKSIDVAAAQGAFASLNFVENTYTSVPVSEGPPPVPEPATVGVLTVGVAGFALRRRRIVRAV